METPPAETLGNRLRAQLGRLLHWLVHLRGSPEEIGLGVALGILVAFTPTIGFQIILATILATVFNASRPAAALMTAITSPPTIPPIYAFTYWLGSLVVPGPPVAEVTALLRDLVAQLGDLRWSQALEQLRAVGAIGTDVFIPLWIGGVAAGGVAGAVAYAPTVRFVRFSRKRVERLRERATALREQAAALRERRAAKRAERRRRHEEERRH